MSISLHSESRSKDMVTNIICSLPSSHDTSSEEIADRLNNPLKLTEKAPYPISRLVREHAWNNSFAVC